MYRQFLMYRLVWLCLRESEVRGIQACNASKRLKIRSSRQDMHGNADKCGIPGQYPVRNWDKREFEPVRWIRSMGAPDVLVQESFFRLFLPQILRSVRRERTER